MSREHARILSRIWLDDDWKKRSPGAQRLYFQLLSQRTLNHAGVLPLQPKKWAAGCDGVSVEDVWRDLKELDEARYIVVDTETEEVLIRSFIRNDGVAKQPNVLKAALRMAMGVESERLRIALSVELRRLGLEAANLAAAILSFEDDGDPSGTPTEPIPNGSGTLPKPVDNPVDKEPLGNPSPGGRGRGKGKGVVVTSQRGSVGGTRERASEDGPDPAAPPPPRCPKHLDKPADGPCRPCGDARRDREAWDTANAERLAQAETDRIRAVRACQLCDGDGWRWHAGGRHRGPTNQRCDHQPLPREESA